MFGENSSLLGCLLLGRCRFFLVISHAKKQVCIARQAMEFDSCGVVLHFEPRNRSENFVDKDFNAYSSIIS